MLTTLAVMVVLLSVVAVPAVAATTNGPLVATQWDTGEIDTIDPTTGARVPIPGAISDARLFSAPSVTPNGSTVVYTGRVGENAELFSVPLDGSAAPTQITSTAGEYSLSFKRDPVVSPDGQTAYFYWERYDSDFNYQSGLYSVPITGGELTEIGQNVAAHLGSKITPDGNYLVYTVSDPETGIAKK